MLLQLTNSAMPSNKRQIIQKGQSKIDIPEKPATHSTQDEDKAKHNTIYVGRHCTQTNTNNVNKTTKGTTTPPPNELFEQKINIYADANRISGFGTVTNMMRMSTD